MKTSKGNSGTNSGNGIPRSNDVFTIPTRNLRVGMTVYKWIETVKGYRLVPDCKLLSHFPTGNKFERLTFKTTAGDQVVWRDCGEVWVSTN